MGVSGWFLMIGLSGSPIGNMNAGFSTGPFQYESGCKAAAEQYKKKVNSNIEYICADRLYQGDKDE